MRETNTLSHAEVEARGNTPADGDVASDALDLPKLHALAMLTAGSVHEVNNLMGYVSGTLEIMNRLLASADHALSTDADLRAALSRHLNGALDGVHRIAELLRELSTLARDDDERSADPLSALRTAIRLAEGRIRPRARLVLNLTPLPSVEAHESRLARVFLNLLLNAADAVAPGAPSDHEIRVSTQVCARGVVIAIEDTGCGIPEDIRSRIFDAFYTTKPRGRGTGLGLSLSRQIVTDYGGSISVHSEVGRGTRVRVVLPTSSARKARA